MRLVHRLLRLLWAEPRPPSPPARVWRDWVLVGLLVPLTVLEGVLRPDLPARWATVILTAGLVPTLLWRRTRPLAMLTIAFVLSSLLPLVLRGPAPDMYSMGYLLILPYSLYRWGSGRDIVLGSALVTGKVGLWLALGYLSLADTLAGFGVVSTACALGAALRYRERSRTRELDQVKLLERERLARDLHDIVAHHVSAIAIRAQAGIATSVAHPAAAVDALQVIEAEASRALAEMRSMVRVLRRDEPADLAPAPRLGDLSRLAGRAHTGPLVDVEISGDVGDLSPSVGTAIYHLAQESVTNARRHARHATQILVQVAADETAVRLTVSDDGDATASSSPGYGLIGMIERADLLGGSCSAGPNPGRGWTVTAVLPRNGSAA